MCEMEVSVSLANVVNLLASYREKAEWRFMELSAALDEWLQRCRDDLVSERVPPTCTDGTPGGSNMPHLVIWKKQARYHRRSVLLDPKKSGSIKKKKGIIKENEDMKTKGAQMDVIMAVIWLSPASSCWPCAGLSRRAVPAKFVEPDRVPCTVKKKRRRIPGHHSMSHPTPSTQ